jgi:hypothetical protein
MIKESNNKACFVSKRNMSEKMKCLFNNFLAAVGNMHLKKEKTENILD